MSKLVGLWSGHDASFCVLNDGRIEMHTELERHARVKEPAGDAIQLFYDHHGDLNDVVGLTTCHRAHGIKEHLQSWNKISQGLPLYVCGHHQSHAAHAFYSSNLDEATVITLDGGGIEDEQGTTVSITAWKGNGTRLDHLESAPANLINVGGVWSRCTRYIFGYESGWPYGHQAGTVMALAAMGDCTDRNPWVKDFETFFHTQFRNVDPHPAGHRKGMSARDPHVPRHPFLGHWRDIAQRDPQAMYDMAAALQTVTENILRSVIARSLSINPGSRNVCLSGGVALNSVAMGKVREWFPQLKNVYVPPVPYDGGLTIGAAQHAWHHVLGNPRVHWVDNVSPYMGKAYGRDDVNKVLQEFADKITVSDCDDDNVLDAVAAGDVVSIFNGRAESGRRALGNRSIIADPRNPDTKARVNERVKHRQWFRPFAPSVIREAVSSVFTTDGDSPYMGFVLKLRDSARAALPAIAHTDGSARLQTVTANDNPWWHSFITRWGDRTGWPVMLNTSLNDSEPICETPFDAIRCFLGTDIDAMYFPEHHLIVRKS